MNKILLLFTTCLITNIYAETYNPNGLPGTLTIGYSSNLSQDGSYKKKSITLPLAEMLTFKYISLRNYDIPEFDINIAGGGSSSINLV